MCANDADYFGEGIFDGAVTVDELEGFAIDGSDAYFEPWAIGGVDNSAHLEAEYFTSEHAVFAHG